MSNCIFCKNEHTPEYLKTMEYRIQHNEWDDIQAVIDVLEQVKQKRWSWVKSDGAKYLNIRLDMRDGGCIILRDNKRISPKQLAWQYSSDMPNPIPDSEAY